jgi:diguanylate cyclase (GGDEF)-like protein
MSKQSSAIAAPAPVASLEPYAQLVRALLPRTDMLAVYNARGELYWSSDIAICADLGAVAQVTLQAAGEIADAPGRQDEINGSPVYCFWMRRDGGAASEPPFALLLVVLRRDGGDETRPFSLVHALVRPAIECLRRELIARDEIYSLHSSLLEQDHDLEMLLSISGRDTQDDDTDDLKHIVTSATEHLHAGLAALIVPERSLVLVRTGKDEPLDKSLLARAHRHLLSVTRVRKDAVIINRWRMEAQGQKDELTYRIIACPVSRADGRPIGVLALFRSENGPEFTPHHGRLTELLARRIAAAIANSYDSLTGLMTRPAFERRVRDALEDPDNRQNAWSALYIDMDRMHVINDNYGMHIGDKVIARFGELVRARLPPGALGARISGDRFAVLVPADMPAAAQFAEGLRAGAEQLSPLFGDGNMQISVSIGVAAVDRRSQELSHAMATAETACKAASDRGRNRVELFEESDLSIVRRFTDINAVADIRSALIEDRLQLYAQLIVPLSASHGPLHFEILLRMIGTDGQTVGPESFMSAAQRYQLMPTIDRWVVERAVSMLRPHAELLQQHSLVFTINFSGQSLQQDAEFTNFVEQIIGGSGIAPSSFCFELTESAAIGQLARAEALMHRLRKLGCNIALDDFGTGLSSLAYLRSLPIGMLKIDGSFVRDVLADPRADSMVQAIAQLARSMGLVTVAEYVETDEIRSRVAALGVDYGQGFSIAQPLPLADILAELPLYVAAAEPTGRHSEAPREPTAALA